MFKNIHGEPIEVKDNQLNTAITSSAINTARYRGSILNNQDELTTYHKQQIFFVDFTYDTIQTRIITVIDQNGSVSTVSNGSIIMENSTDIASRTLMVSKRFYKYNLAGTYEIFMALRFFPTTYDSLTRIDCGLISSQNGNAFGYFNGEFGVVSRYNNVDTVVAQSDWNLDKMDGTGPSRMVLDISKINLYRIWSQNIGKLLFSIADSSTDLQHPRFANVHVFNNCNTDQLYASQPNLFVCMETNSNGSALQAKTECFSISVNSNLDQYFTVNPSRSLYNTKNLATTKVPIFSFKNKSTYLGRQNRQQVFINGLSFSTDGNRLSLIEIQLNPTITGAVFTDIDTNLSILEYSNAGTAIAATGEIVFQIPAGKVDSNYIDLSSLRIILFPGETFSVIGSTLSGTTDIGCTIILTENL